MRARATAAGWLFAVSAGVVMAQPGPLDRAELDRRTAVVVFQSAQAGSDLFNKGKYEGCYRLYQGTLLAVQPLLDHRPKLAELARDRLAKAETLPPEKGAFVLREALDAIQAETAVALAPAKKAGPPLWERLGGEKAVRAVVKDWTAASVADPKVNFSRGGKYPTDEKTLARFEQTTVELVSEVGGGPFKYSGRDMVAAHTGMRITDVEYLAMTGHLIRALDKNGVPKDVGLELLGIVGAYRQHVVGK